MKLFIFRPKQFGPNTYIVMSEDEQQARAAVKKYCEKEMHVKDHTNYGGLDSKIETFAIYGDDTENQYEMETYTADQVAVNDNS